jgi:hypothetical protein
VSAIGEQRLRGHTPIDARTAQKVHTHRAGSPATLNL